jgi:DNA-binding transcriptional regulator YdaS (Cro superfamily)
MSVIYYAGIDILVTIIYAIGEYYLAAGGCPSAQAATKGDVGANELQSLRQILLSLQRQHVRLVFNQKDSISHLTWVRD